ncbi:porin [Paraburkholderia susongensis]|uniref:Porin, GBP family n=1 Tax=Paraburkholderia susongensis TaxID=1515439 RepID=A0A1X7ISX8_9BURK|nr:porin [Paraburkholderia susongensis]SMG17969.1 porin, GBP family [Paraburkholderia susongensis]
MKAQKGDTRITHHAALALTASLVSVSAHAQSSVQIYGIVDAAAAYVSNIAGHAAVQEISGIMNANRLGLRGSESLGSGVKAVFTLEGGFNINDGSMLQGSPGTTRFFGRQSFVGLQFPWLTVTAGRQYDTMFDLLAYSAAPYMSSYWLRPGVASNLVGANGSSADFDRLGGVRVDNSVKAVSTPINGWTFTSMFGLGGQPGTLSTGSTLSLGARYQGEALGVGAAYTNFKEPNGSGNYVTWGAGASYRLAELSFNALYTNTRFTPTADSVQVVEVGAHYQLSPWLSVSAAYAFMLPNHDSSNVIIRGNRNQFGASIDYAFSKRTDVYAVAIRQQTAGGNPAQIFTLPSTGIGMGSAQTLVALGLRHRF